MKSFLFALPALAVALPASEPRVNTKTSSAAPPNASIKSVAYGGTGCPQNSASIIISDGGTVLTAIFDSFLVETYGTTQLKSCQLNVDVAFPSGWSFSVAQVDQRGSADLDANVTGTIDIYTYFSGQTQQTKTEQSIVGPYSDDYIVTSKTGVAVFSPCGAQGDAALNIKSQIKLTEPKNLDSHGLLTSDSIDSKLTQVYYLDWDQC